MRLLRSLVVACLVVACGRAELEYPEYSNVSGRPVAKAGAGGHAAGSAPIAGAAGAIGGKAGAAGVSGGQAGTSAAGGASTVPGSCVTLEIDGPPVDFAPDIVGARATSMREDGRVVVAMWASETGSNDQLAVRPALAWGAWPPVVVGAHLSPFAGPVPGFAMSSGRDPSTYATVFAPLVNAEPGQVLSVSRATGDGAAIDSLLIDQGVGIAPLATAPASLGHLTAYGLSPSLQVGLTNNSVTTHFENIGCASSPMVADVAVVATSPWLLYSSARPFGTCLLPGAPLGMPSLLLLARLDQPEAGLEWVPLGTVASVEGDFLTLARLFPFAGGALIAHRYAGANAFAEPGISLERVDAKGQTSAGPVEILQPFHMPAAALAEVKGNLFAVYADPNTGQLLASVHAPEAGNAALASTVVPLDPGGVLASVQFAVSEPGGDRVFVGWTESLFDTPPRLRVARLRCQTGE